MLYYYKMPKVEIDYSNTLFYKIYCVNPDITDMYIGHTTNFIQRKYAHKQCTANSKSPIYNSKLYTYIRNHGGWDNWNMEIIAFHKCEDKYVAREYEQKYFKEYKATLNSIQPCAPPKIKLEIEREKKEPLYCNTCNVSFATTNLHEVHNKTKKHINGLETMEIMDIQKMPIIIKHFVCENCNFSSSKKSNYNTHIMTAKHKTGHYLDKKMQTNAKVEFKCECGKIYTVKSSFYYHKNKCTFIEEEKEEEKVEAPDYKELLILAMTQMQEQQTQMQRTDDLVSEAMIEMSAMRKENNELVTKMTEMIPKMTVRNIMREVTIDKN
jgi:hypothetical protein